MTARIGIQTPVVFQPPQWANAWEADATVADVVAIARAADTLGYHHLTASEHVGVPTREAARRGAAYWDPLVTLAFLAANTTTIRLATHVVVLGYHHPAEILKRYGTLDLVSGGRLVLGVGVGSLREEFDVLGASFDDRGARADEALAAIRAGWGTEEPRHRGPFYDLGELTVRPTSPRDAVPIWVGGSTPRSLRRAVRFGTGWAPFGLAPAEIRRHLDAAEALAGFDVVLPVERLDPVGAPDETRRRVTEVLAAGATVLNAAFVHDDRDGCIVQLERMRELFDAELEWTPR